MDTTVALWTAVKNNPEDTMAKQALADSLQDDGDDLCDAVYWCLSRNRWPIRRMWSNSDDVWTWQAGRANRIAKKTTAVLPNPIYRMTAFAQISDSGYYTREQFLAARRDQTLEGRMRILLYATRQCRDLSNPAVALAA